MPLNSGLGSTVMLQSAFYSRKRSTFILYECFQLGGGSRRFVGVGQLLFLIPRRGSALVGYILENFCRTDQQKNIIAEGVDLASHGFISSSKPGGTCDKLLLGRVRIWSHHFFFLLAPDYSPTSDPTHLNVCMLWSGLVKPS